MHTKAGGALTVVGTGINALAQCSIETQSYIHHADIVFALVTDAMTLAWLEELNGNVVDLQPQYQLIQNSAERDATGNDVQRPRHQTYEAITELICAAVRSGQNVVAVFYGHPGVFVHPSHAAIKRLHAEGYKARMLPGISAEDCLFADLGVDPSRAGCTQLEATAFLFFRNVIDTTMGLILWQMGVVGDHSLQRLRPAPEGVRVLTEKLLRSYPATHDVVLYEAASFPLAQARIDWMPLSSLPDAVMTTATTLYIPPLSESEADEEFLAKLNLSLEAVMVPLQVHHAS